MVAGNTFAVIDGATAVVDVDMNGLNSSAYAAQFLAEYLAQHGHTGKSAKELLIQANTAIREDLLQNWPDVYALGKEGPCAAALILCNHGDTFSFAQIADCNLVSRTQDGAWHLLSEISAAHSALDKKSEALRQKYLAQGLPLSEIRSQPEVREFSRYSRNQSNVSYGDFNGEPEMEQFVVSGTFNAADYTDLILFSDGMDWLEAESDEEELMQAAQKMASMGLQAYHSHLRALYDADPMVKKYIRHKHMDDATALHLTLQP